MRASKTEADFWHFLPAAPRSATSFKRGNFVVILLLAFLVLGVFVGALGSEILHSKVAISAPPHVHHVVHRG